MAEESEKSKKPQTYTDIRPAPTFIGMDRDSIPELKMDGSYSYAQNASTTTLDGKYGIVRNEKGNRRCGDLMGRKARVVGSILINDGIILNFVAYKTSFIRDGVNYPPHAAIIMHKPDCTTQVIIRSECLDFLSTDIVTAEYKIHNGCDLILYITNKRTELLSINLNNLERYHKKDFSGTDPNIPINGEFGWDCGMFKMHSDINYPDIILNSINTNGSLAIGSYYINIRYLDSDLTPYAFSRMFGPIIITPNPREYSGFQTTGGIVTDINLNDGKIYANKNIKLTIRGLDIRYPFFQLGILSANQGTDTFNEAFISTAYGINEEDLDIIISSLTASSGYVPVSNEELVNDFEHIYTVKHLDQIQNRLILANIENKVRDWGEFQKYANKIKVLYYTSKGIEHDVNGCEIDYGSYKNKNEWYNNDYTNPEMIYDNKGLMRDEVYALSIQWLFKNGDTSPAFHIPGRPALGESNTIDINGRYTVSELELPYEGMITPSVARTRWYFETQDDYRSGNQSERFDGIYDSYNAPPGLGWDRVIYKTHASYNKKPIRIPTSYSYPGYPSAPSLNDISDLDPDSIDSMSPDYPLYNSMNQVNIPIEENIFSGTLSCNDNDEVERWQFVNTSIKYYQEKGVVDINSPFYQLYLEARGNADDILIYSAGLCGYYESESQYPNSKDCNGNYIYPHSFDENGNVIMHRIRHHRMPDARKERFFDISEEDIEKHGRVAAEKIFDNNYEIYPLNLYCYNIEVPPAYADEVVGYNILISDRAGNKTVIDKGWLNVCDASYYYRRDMSDNNTLEVIDLYNELGTISVNPVFMYPTDKYFSSGVVYGITGIGTGGYNESGQLYVNGKTMRAYGGNYVEFWSPKSSYNELVNLQASHYKLENTLIGSIITNSPYSNIDVLSDGDDDNSPESWEGAQAWRFMSASRITRAHLPRMSYRETRGFYLLHNLPIIHSEYTIYNSELISKDSLLLYNGNHQQTIMVSKLYQESVGLKMPVTYVEYFPQASIYYPLAYNNWNPENGDFTSTADGISVSYDLFNSRNNYGVYIKGIVQYASDRDQIGKENKSPHLYYAALKSNIQPYNKLENIVYLYYDNKVKIPEQWSVFLRGGDTFISEQSLYKSYYRDTNGDSGNDNDNGKIGSTLLIGYVESEINTHYRHRIAAEKYKSYPHNNVKTVLVDDITELKDDLIDMVKQEYHYNLDYSSLNRTKVSFPLSDTFNYCSDCSERYPHMYRWSMPITGSESIDYYKSYMSNDFSNIPTDSGEISNVFTKEEQLFIHTTDSLFRVNLSPQEIETGNDKISIGTGSIGEAIPQKIFDDVPGFGMGGTEFELTGHYCNNAYIWVDTKNYSVWKIEGAPEKISSKGVSNDLEDLLVQRLNEYWKFLRGVPYPYLNTHDEKSVGVMAVYDNANKRYIITKKDYQFTETAKNLTRAYEPNEPLEEGYYYHTDTGLYRALNGIGGLYLEEVDFENDPNFINKSFTLSYSLEYNSWTSYHDYRPNHMSHNNKTFYSTINNDSLAIRDFIWEHDTGEYCTYYDKKFDFIFEYVDLGTDTFNSRLWENIAYTSNMYIENETTGFNRESLLHTCDRIMLYNNIQSSGVFNVVVKNKLPYFDVYNFANRSRIITAHRYGNMWKINNLRDYSKNVEFDPTGQSMETIATKSWDNIEYRSIFMNGNMGYIDMVSNPDYLDYNQSVYGLKKFEDKFLYVRMFFKPDFNFKINIILKGNNKQIFV